MTNVIEIGSKSDKPTPKELEPAAERCEVCRFSCIALNEVTHTVLCRRYPPTVIGSLAMKANVLGKLEPAWNTATSYVQVANAAWCGEFQPREPTP